MATMATNHVSVAMGQVATTSLPCYSHYFFPTTLRPGAIFLCVDFTCVKNFYLRIGLSCNFLEFYEYVICNYLAISEYSNEYFCCICLKALEFWIWI